MIRKPTPRTLFLVLSCSVFVGEATLMAALAGFPPLSPPVEGVLNATLLTLLLAPVLWGLVVVPLRNVGAESQAILRTAMDGYWMTDGRGRILEVNDAYCRLVGYSRDELLGMHISDLDSDETPEETAKRAARIMRAGSARFLARHRRKDGVLIDVEVSVNYMPSKGGRFFVFLRDVTQRLRDESELRKMNEARYQAVLHKSQSLEAEASLPEYVEPVLELLEKAHAQLASVPDYMQGRRRGRPRKRGS